MSLSSSKSRLLGDRENVSSAYWLISTIHTLTALQLVMNIRNNGGGAHNVTLDGGNGGFGVLIVTADIWNDGLGI